MQGMMINRAKELLRGGTVNRVLGWQAGEFVYDITPAVFETEEELDEVLYTTAFAATTCPNTSSRKPLMRAKSSSF